MKLQSCQTGGPDLLGKHLIQIVRAVDDSCNELLNGYELGLCNIKLQWQSKLFAITGKKLTEEPLLAWHLNHRLKEIGVASEWEVTYPAPYSRLRCDLVVQDSNKKRMWIEVKLAWKAWFNCVGTPTFHNRAYEGYIYGSPDRTHSLRDDFSKLSRVSPSEGSDVGVLLVGFDNSANPMDSEVNDVFLSARQIDPRWLNVAHDSWSDRRDSRFRINCWLWHRMNLA